MKSAPKVLGGINAGKCTAFSRRLPVCEEVNNGSERAFFMSWLSGLPISEPQFD